MADNDIYNNKKKYERFVQNIEVYLEPPEKNRKYQIKNRLHLEYFKKLILRFEVDDISYIRRLRLLRSFIIVCHCITKDLIEVGRDDIDAMVACANKYNRSVTTRRDFIKDLKHMWKVILPDRDEKGRVDDSIVPYVVRHLSGRIDKSRQKLRKDRLTIEEYERILVGFANDPRMQALLSVILESLGRPQELLGRSIGDVEVFDNYAKITISERGKEGIGVLRCIDSFFYLTKWLNVHPLKHDPKAPLFVNIGNSNTMSRLKPSAANTLLRRRCKRLGLEKPITLYSFKRNGITMCRLRGDSDVDIQHRARWNSTKQLKTYDLSTQEDSFKLELIKRGLIEPDGNHHEIAPLQKTCLFCQHTNGISESVCVNCKRPLNRSAIEKQEAEKVKQANSMAEELVRIKRELAQNKKRDELIFSMLQRMVTSGNRQAVLDSFREADLLAKLAEVREG